MPTRLQLSLLFLLAALVPCRAFAQSPDGPMVPRPDVSIQQPPKRSEATIKAKVVLVNAPVTVRDSKDQIVTSLEAKDFQLTDHGVAQTITHFDVGGDPISLVVLFETSSRIVPMLPAIQKSGILITETILGANGEAAIVGFNDSIDKLLPFSKNADEIQSSVWHLQAGTSGSRLYDAMNVGVEMLTGLPEATATTPGRRRILLIVSEASDFGSQAKLGEVLRKAQLQNITIYSVGLSTTRALLQQEPKQNHTDISPPGTYPLPPIPGKPPVPEEEDPRLNNTVDLMALAVWAVSHVADKVSAHALEVAATATGGAHFATFKDRTIEKALDEIGGELHTQYTIGYTPTNTTATGYHEIKVSLLDPKYKNLKLRSRPGYYVASDE
ncbi:MAG: VWA domain-containing protein [Acidobacteria bacterium]|nr:VWA domain-containing protein [Acidobacteriota bacterium]MBS1864307.1 VWA domain-containing protein [Acidobacteriota bacterium]